MNCRKVSHKLSAYIEGDLSPKELRGFEDHLNNCILCQRKLADIKLVIQTSNNLEQKTPGPHFTNRLLCAVNQQKNSSTVYKTWQSRLVLSGAAFVAAAVFTFILINTQNPAIPTQPITVKIPAEISNNTDSSDIRKGFPVSGDALKRDMSLTEQPEPDSIGSDSIILPRHYVQPVGIKKAKKNNDVF